MSDYVARLRLLVDAGAAALRALDDEASARPLAPGKWSPRQVVGHLIDSASNNHARFLRAQGRDDLRFPGYDQEAWVDRQRYQSAPWSELVTLWELMNRHLVRVMEAMPEAERDHPRADHNLDEIAWRPVPPVEPTTMGYLMEDYVGHLEHHLRQVLGAGWPRAT